MPPDPIPPLLAPRSSRLRRHDRSTIVSSNTLVSPLGQVKLAGRAEYGVGCRERVFGSFALVYLYDGSGVYEDENGLHRDLVPGDLVLVFPKLRHTYGPTPGGRFSELFVVFDGIVFDAWLNTGLLNTDHPVYHLEPVDYWASQFEFFLEANSQFAHVMPTVQVCALQKVLAEALARGQRQDDTRAGPDWIADACQLIEAMPLRERNWEAVATQLGVGYETFRHRFTESVGISPARYHVRRLIDRACELMLSSDMTQKQIASLLGFADEFYFSRCFKSVTGQSPRRFRSLGPRQSKKP